MEMWPFVLDFHQDYEFRWLNTAAAAAVIEEALGQTLN